MDRFWKVASLNDFKTFAEFASEEWNSLQRLDGRSSGPVVGKDAKKRMACELRDLDLNNYSHYSHYYHGDYHDRHDHHNHSDDNHRNSNHNYFHEDNQDHDHSKHNNHYQCICKVD